MTDDIRPKSAQSLGTLITELPSLFIALLKAELAQLTASLKSKAVNAGVGIGLIVFALVLIFFMAGVLVAAAVLALAQIFSPWLAALLVAAGLLILAAIAALIAVSALKKVTPIVPAESVDSVKEDLSAIKGMGKYDR